MREHARYESDVEEINTDRILLRENEAIFDRV